MKIRTPLVTGEYYHVFNRGVEKLPIFRDQKDLMRFFLSVKEFNTKEPIGSLYEITWGLNPQVKQEKLVEIVSFCLNPNHFHLLLKQVSDNGISEYMKRLSGGFTGYFNKKYKRTGVLFQGRFKSIHVDSNEYLLHLSVYINLNNRQKGEKFMLSKSSWEEYLGEEKDHICNTDIIIGQFKNTKEYKEFALSSYEDILNNKIKSKEVFELGG
jgi:REP element-mobilizing transposase RayT